MFTGGFHTIFAASYIVLLFREGGGGHMENSVYSESMNLHFSEIGLLLAKSSNVC